MKMRKRSLRETGKSMLLVFLALSAFYLAARSQLAPEFPGQLSFGSVVSDLADWFKKGSGSGSAAARLTEAAIPVRIAVYNSTGRRGVQYNAAEADDLFGQVGGLLAEALDTAEAPSKITEAEWRKALTATGCYFDFLGNVPLSALSAWLNGDKGNHRLAASARRILVAETGEGETLLYYINAGDGLFYACRTGEILHGRLDKALSFSLSNGAAFAFEQGALYQNVAPYAMMLTQTPEVPVLTVSNPIEGEAGLQLLLKILGFNTHTTSVYPVESGQVVKEGDDSLRITDSGTVAYYSNAQEEQATFPVPCEGETPTQAEAIEAARRLAVQALGSLCGEDARLYLIDIAEQDDGSFNISFGYSVDGAPVLFSDNKAAAQMVVDGKCIRSFTFRFRTYVATEETMALLPERQAVAAMESLKKSGGELLLGYVDGGDTLLHPGWVVR